MQAPTPPQSYALILAVLRSGAILFCNAKHCLFIGVSFFVNLPYFKLVLTPITNGITFSLTSCFPDCCSKLVLTPITNGITFSLTSCFPDCCRIHKKSIIWTVKCSIHNHVPCAKNPSDERFQILNKRPQTSSV